MMGGIEGPGVGDESRLSPSGVSRRTGPHGSGITSGSRPAADIGRGRPPRLASLVLIGLAMGAAAVHADPAGVVCLEDPRHDWLLRPTDADGSLPFDPATHRPIDLLQLSIGSWSPAEPTGDLFEGEYAPEGLFLRLDLRVDGLVNPPGPSAPSVFDPFAYGDNPVYGFVEFDMDVDEETGGELEAPEFRYVGNAVRFGSKPAVESLEDRFALDASAFDGDFMTRPFVDRSGEEFHLALLGGAFGAGDVTVVSGDGDLEFEPGEAWEIEGPWFHRAHGYEPFSLAQGGGAPGAYEPPCVLRFAHDPSDDTTVLSLVFPLTNEAAAAMRGEPPEPPDFDPSNQFSVHEALVDLHLSAVFLSEFPTGLPEEHIIIEWEHKQPEDFLVPGAWAVNVILGTSYTAPDPSGEYFVWTDIHPDGLRGDVNGDGEADTGDVRRIERFIDDEGGGTGSVVLSGFPANFSVFDVNHDGVVDDIDVLLVSVPGDVDGDHDVDLTDFSTAQRCFAGPEVPIESTPCRLVDLDTDGDVDSADVVRMLVRGTGPGCEHQ